MENLQVIVVNCSLANGDMLMLMQVGDWSETLDTGDFKYKTSGPLGKSLPFGS